MAKTTKAKPAAKTAKESEFLKDIKKGFKFKQENTEFEVIKIDKETGLIHTSVNGGTYNDVFTPENLITRLESGIFKVIK